jgi:hypothetical protein
VVGNKRASELFQSSVVCRAGRCCRCASNRLGTRCDFFSRTSASGWQGLVFCTVPQRLCRFRVEQSRAVVSKCHSTVACIAIRAFLLRAYTVRLYAPSLKWLPCILAKHTWFSVHMCALFNQKVVIQHYSTCTCTYIHVYVRVLFVIDYD